MSLPGERVWDPFGGSGTTALEALLLGREAISTDINPITEVIGKAKCTTLTPEQELEIIKLSDKFSSYSKSKESFDEIFTNNLHQIIKLTPTVPNKEKWFETNQWNELSFIKWSINKLEDNTIRNVLFALLSKIIIKVSNQDSETRYVSKVNTLPEGKVLDLYIKEIKNSLPKFRQAGKILNFREPSFSIVDLRQETNIESNSIDLIVTSPPYPNATDYHLYHRFRIFWLGHNPVDVGKKEIGSHLRHQKEKNGIEKYLEEMKLCLNNFYSALRPGRYAVLIIGDSIFKNKHYKTAELVSKEASSIGFEVVGIFKREVHATKRSFISAARRLKEEKFLIIRKRSQNQKFNLIRPPYKLWPYEEQIRKIEIRALLGKCKISNGQELSVEVDSMKVDQLKKLAFTHHIEAKNYSRQATWQSIVENGDASKNVSKRKDPKYATHGVHNYKGKFYPQLAKSLFNLANLKEGQRVLDPFCGSGTVILEGYLNGIDSVGLDLNPIALKISKAKTEILQVDPYLTDKILSNFIRQVEKIKIIKGYAKYYQSNNIDELESWFPKKVLEKITPIIKEINEVPNLKIKNFLEVCLSSIIRKVTQQEPQDLRIRRRKVPLIDAPVFELFIKKVKNQREKIRYFSARSTKSNTNFGKTQIVNCDSRVLNKSIQNSIQKESFDCVITSPPYAAALPYVDTDRLSILLLCSMLSGDRKKIEDSLVGARDMKKSSKDLIEEKIETKLFNSIRSKTAKALISKVHKQNSIAKVGFRKKNMASVLYRYFEDMTLIMENLNWATKQNGNLFFVIGDNKTFLGEKEIETAISSAKILKEIGKSIGWKLIQSIPITVTQENRKHNKNSILENDIIWFQKIL